MPISVVCNACSAKLNAPDAAAGKKVKCPKCQGILVVPTPESQFEVVADEPPPPKKKSAPSAKPKVPVKAAVEDDDDEDEDRPRKKKPVKAAVEDDDDEDEKPRKKKKQAEDEDEDEDRPRKKKKKGEAAGGASMKRNLIGLAVLLVLLGVGAAIYYYKFFKEDDTKPTVKNPDPKENPPDPNPKQPPDLNPKQPGPNPGVPSTKYDRANAVKAALLHGEWLIMWEGGIVALKEFRDANSASRACQALEKHTAEIQRITTELKALGRFPRDSWPPGAVDETGEKRLHSGYPAVLMAAEKRIEGFGMPELSEKFRTSVENFEKANQEFQAAFKAIYPG